MHYLQYYSTRQKQTGWLGIYDVCTLRQAGSTCQCDMYSIYGLICTLYMASFIDWSDPHIYIYVPQLVTKQTCIYMCQGNTTTDKLLTFKFMPCPFFPWAFSMLVQLNRSISPKAVSIYNIH